MNLKNKTVIVTGASQGIGAGIALAFAKEGSNLVIAYRNNEEGAKEVEGKSRQLGSEVLLFQGDLSDEIIVDRLFENTQQKFPTIDILVNNAGKSNPKEILEASKEDWINTFDDNFFNTVLCTKKALEIMKKQGYGKVINTASINGLEHVGKPKNIAYSTAKAAVINLTKTLAKGYAPNIQINAVAPGKTKTDYWLKKHSDDLKKVIDDIPIKRLLAIEEIADVFILLAKNDGKTGEVIVADGGFSLRDYQ